MPTADLPVKKVGWSAVILAEILIGLHLVGLIGVKFLPLEQFARQSLNLLVKFEDYELPVALPSTLIK